MANFTHHLKEPYLSFYNLKTNELKESIWEELQDGLWETFKIDSYLFNNEIPAEDLHQNVNIFENVYQILPGTYWDSRCHMLKKDLYIPNKIEEKLSLSNFIKLAEKYFYNLNAKRIGVHLSGGLDSSFIMAVLKVLGIPFVPIGLQSDTFEFRTERIIQDIFLEWGEDGLLIDIESYPFYSELKSIPAHQIPDADIKSIASSRALAHEFKIRGCDLVFTGQGGDSLFVDEIKSVETQRINIPNEFLNPTEQIRVYDPEGIKLQSFYAEKMIVDFFVNARLGQKTDSLKLWMRNWAKEILPRELSEFSYYADFFGLTMWGLHEARPVIKELMEEAYDISKFPHFSPKNVKRFLNQDMFSFEHKDYIQYCGLISVASWYHSLFNN